MPGRILATEDVEGGHQAGRSGATGPWDAAKHGVKEEVVGVLQRHQDTRLRRSCARACTPTPLDFRICEDALGTQRAPWPHPSNFRHVWSWHGVCRGAMKGEKLARPAASRRNCPRMGRLAAAVPDGKGEVPEPGTPLRLGSGLLGLAAVGWRRYRRKSSREPSTPERRSAPGPGSCHVDEKIDRPSQWAIATRVLSV